MKKLVLELHDDKGKKKAMKTVSGFSGIDSIAMDMKDKKLTVTGDIDPVTLVAKLTTLCYTEIVTFGPPEKEKEKEKEIKYGIALFLLLRHTTTILSSQEAPNCCVIC